MPFKETQRAAQKLAKKYSLGLISNIDDKLLGQTRRHINVDFDLVVTAQQVRSYKPEPAHFTECAQARSAASAAGFTSARATTTTSFRASKRGFP